MSDKPLAGILAAFIAVPLVVLCCAAPLLVLSSLTAVTAWIGGADPVSALLIAFITAGAVIGIRQWRKRNAPTMKHPARDGK